jgi:phosphatidylglycerophosphatase A|tara:strand:- start:605 stop:1090 length:486 start_codon:yes stop_codon:yes gene_type:complete
MSEFPNLKKPYDFIASLGGIGLIPFAPGTFGSIFAWLVFVIMSHFVNMLIYTIAIVFIAIWVCEKASVNLIQKDHKSIVIDELAGMWVALVPVIYFASNQFERIIYACLALVFFRVFDILKPFPISYFDKKYKNGFGIVLDDIIAGIFSGILSVLIVVFLI